VCKDEAGFGVLPSWLTDFNCFKGSGSLTVKISENLRNQQEKVQKNNTFVIIEAKYECIIR